MTTGEMILATVTDVDGYAVYLEADGHRGALGLSGEGEPPYLGGRLMETPKVGDTLLVKVMFVNPASGDFGARGLAYAKKKG